ncbi:LAQU0S10e02652g1_1 [Lachancea quebecensis]|uniref:Aminopeptidase n=1 Tax=Lachancea quebecensis TaxID=1654605 RepID=A0A0P1KTI0_9SACH|nr:LAQU0S10e02652g1_1 [Lachancea quebecensis]
MTEKQTLPTHFQPLHYSIELECLEEKAKRFRGKVSINFKVQQACDKVYLNIRDLDIDTACIVKNNHEKVNPVSLEYEPTNEVVVLAFSEELRDDFTLALNYRGTIQTNMTGFYQSEYNDTITGEVKTMLSTQFEATDARKAFPCLDEPLLKATFDVSITASSELVVLSNMPSKLTEVSLDGKTTKHSFHTSPKMSTYLVAWALGEFEYIEGHTEKCIYPANPGCGVERQKLPIRVYTSKGKAYQGTFALGVASKVIDYYSRLFDIPYPLPKLDLLCVEAYSHNAMENFSLITFRPTALLLEGGIESADPLVLQKIAYVVSHEIAHQWFGNLVTMKWWDELWLNEGFATWVGYHAISEFFPEWDVTSLVMLDSHEVALQLDSLAESHAVKVHVKNAKDIDQVFDAISYLKGCSILEMISEYVGADKFLGGVALYLKRNSFANATMEDLLGSIGEVCGSDILVRLQNWILNIGFPLLKVKATSADEVKLTQERFLSTATHVEDSTLWWIPLMPEGSMKTQELELWEKSSSLRVPEGNLLHFNAAGFGFYRVKYEDKALLYRICDNLGLISSRGKIGLLSDVQTTESASVLLEVLSYFSRALNRDDGYVWVMVYKVCASLLLLSYKSSSLEAFNKIKTFVLSLSEPLIADALAYLRDPSSISSDQSDAHRSSKTRFYDQVLLVTGALSHERVVHECQEIFNANLVTPATRNVVLSTILAQPEASESLFDEVMAELDTATLAHKETIIAALGKVQNPQLFQKSLQLIFRLQSMDVQFLTTAWTTNPYIWEHVWPFVQNNYDSIHEHISANPTVIERFIRNVLNCLVGSSLKKDVERFFKDKDVAAFDRALHQGLEIIERNTLYVKKNFEDSTFA